VLLRPGSCLQDGLRNSCCKQHVEQRRRGTSLSDVSKCRDPNRAASGSCRSTTTTFVRSSFLEKPADPPPMPGKPDKSLASMGIYVLRHEISGSMKLRNVMRWIRNSSHDFGKDIIPYIVKQGRAVAHQFSRSCVRSGNDPRTYWRGRGNGGRILVFEYRSHRRSAGNSTCTTAHGPIWTSR